MWIKSNITAKQNIHGFELETEQQDFFEPIEIYDVKSSSY